MIGVIGEIKEWIGLVTSLWVWLAVGGALGFLGGLFRPLLGYAGVALGGAIIMFVFVLNDWAGDRSDEIDRLKAINAALQAKQLELRLTEAEHRKLIERLGEAAAHNEKQIAELEKILEAVPEDPDCALPEDYRDALRNIR